MASTLLVAGDRLLGAASGKVDYRRTDDGWFEFDSVGLNGWDDKGVPGSNRAEEQPEWLGQSQRGASRRTCSDCAFSSSGLGLGSGA